MSQEIYPVPDEYREHTHITEPRYQDMYQRSVEDLEGFWSEQAKECVSWFGRWNRVRIGISKQVIYAGLKAVG